MKRKLKLPWTDPDDRTKPNLIHMNALLNAVEGGDPASWRKHPISQEEIAAAYRATGRTPAFRQPGDDFEEDPLGDDDPVV